MVAYWWTLWWLIGGRCGGSLLEDVVAHWWKMWWLIGGRCGGSLAAHQSASRTGIRHIILGKTPGIGGGSLYMYNAANDSEQIKQPLSKSLTKDIT